MKKFLSVSYDRLEKVYYCRTAAGTYRITADQAAEIMSSWTLACYQVEEYEHNYIHYWQPVVL